MFRTALATTLLTVLALTICQGSARGAFPGADGKIAFVNDRNGTPSIFTTDAAGSNVEKLVLNNPQGGFAVTSPDGKRILFSVRIATKLTFSYELWVMSADGTHIGRFFPQASDRPYASTWSPDGKRIAFYRDDNLWLAKADRSGAREITDADFSGAAPSWSKKGLIAFDRAGSIWVVNPKSGKERRVGPGSQPSWSSDGRRLLYVAVPRSAKLSDIFAMRANGSGRRQLTKTRSVNETQPAWAPGGRWIAFTGKKGVYAMRSDGKKRRLVAAKGLQPSWAKGASGIVFTRRTPRWNGFVLRTNLNGKHTRWLLRPRLDASPTWSPDGSRLAFTRDGIVYLVGADGGIARSTGLKGADPAWSPNGDNLVVASGLDLVIANSDGTEPAPLDLGFDASKFTHLSQPDWSTNKKDVSSIAFVATSSEGLSSIFVLNLQAKTLTAKAGTLQQLPLGCGTIGASSPSWAPDGGLIAYACDQFIAFSASDGSNPTPLGAAENATLAWSPDGSQIVYSSQSGDQGAQLNIMNSDGTAPTQLDTGPGSSDQPDWQPLP
jgi:Tol biopolymer transport system component